MDVRIDTQGNEQKIWIKEDFLCEKTGVKADYLRIRGRYLHNKGNLAWEWKQIDGAFYYEYYSIPNHKGYKDKLPLAEILDMARNPYKGESLNTYLQDKIGAKISQTLDYKIKTYYEYEKNMSSADALAYQYAAYQVISDVWQNRNEKQFGYENLELFMKGAMAHLNNKGQLKIKNYLSFRRDVKNWLMSENKIDYLVSGHFGNSNRSYRLAIEVMNPETAELITIDLHETLYNQLYMNIGYANKEYKDDLHQKYKDIMEKMGFGDQAMSYRSFCLQTNKYKTKVLGSLARDGEKHFDTKYSPYILAEKVMKRNSMWCADGSGSKLSYRASDGTERTLMILRIYDVASWRILGYCIYEPKVQTYKGKKYISESPEHVLEALKMALKTAKKGAKELLSDNAGSFTNITDKINKIVGLHRTIAPGNSQANPSEMLQRLTAELGRKQFNWKSSGFNATNVDHIRNSDNIEIKDLPTMSDAYAQVEALIQEWNYTIGKDGKSPVQRYEEADENGVEIDRRGYRYCFGKEHKVDVSYMRGFINIEEDTVEHHYDIPQWETTMELINQKTGYRNDAKVSVFHDGAKADIYTQNEDNKLEYILTCSRVKKAHKTFAESTDDTKESLKILEAKKEQFYKAAQIKKENTLVAQKGLEYSLENLTENEYVVEPKRYEDIVRQKNNKTNVKDMQWMNENAIQNESALLDDNAGFDNF